MNADHCHTNRPWRIANGKAQVRVIGADIFAFLQESANVRQVRQDVVGQFIAREQFEKRPQVVAGLLVRG